jgi:TIR domain-containing protein
MVIFINYRRDDSRAITQLIDDRLRVEFGGANVFRDIDSIPLGADFEKRIGAAVGNCDLLLAVIGDRWVTKRLFDDNDFVRKEIEVALEQGIRPRWVGYSLLV